MSPCPMLSAARKIAPFRSCVKASALVCRPSSARPAGPARLGCHDARTPIEAGDRLMIRCGAVSADVLFAHCGAGNGIARARLNAGPPVERLSAMSISAKRRETEVFSLAFLDCICCGFGAVILVFILTVTQKTNVDKADVDAARDRLKKVQSSVSMTKEELDRLAAVLAAAQLELQDINAKSTQDQLKLTDRKRELLLMLQQTGALKDALHTLLGEKKALPDRGRRAARAHSQHRSAAVSHGRKTAG